MILEVGDNMDIKYYSSNNKCFNDNIGSISIESINFTDIEKINYSDYIINWSGHFNDNTTFSSNNRFVNNLSNGEYSFKIVSLTTNAQTSPLTINITSPDKLIITEVKNSEYSCDNNGYIYIEISGGIPPYIAVANSSISTNSSSILFSGVSPGAYNISVKDKNGCVYNYPNEILIKDSNLSLTINDTQPPAVLDSYGKLSLSVSGPGPFDFLFTNINTNNKIFVNLLETKYLTSFNSETETYTYIFSNLLTPGIYDILISNAFKCVIKSTITIPNINPITANINIKNDTGLSNINPAVPLPIFDTLLVPYNLIISDSEVWQLIKDKNLNDEIEFLINDQIYTFHIIRNISNKFCIDNDEIEILQLDNNSNNWFFYIYIAPSININNNPDFLSATIKIKGLSKNFDVVLGLNEYGVIDSDRPSLIRGSFIFDGLGYNQFYNGANLCLSFQDPTENSICDIEIRNTKKTIYRNTYNTSFVTIVNFLEQFNILTKNINIHKSTCDISKDVYLYILNIKRILQLINNSNYFLNDIYLYNKNNIIHNATISIDINGNTTLLNEDGKSIDNIYSIDYLYLDIDETEPKFIFSGSEIIKNVNFIENIIDGYYLIRIKDLYNNITKFIRNNDKFIRYDIHCIEAKRLIQLLNSNLLKFFQYGDILIYIGLDNEIISNKSVPTIAPIVETNLPTTSPITTIPNHIVKQTNDNNNTGIINILYMNKNIKCYLYGPKNWTYEFNSPIQFVNLVPGIYTILADEKELKQYSLYQNETRIIVETNNIYDINLNFISYENSIFIGNL